MPACSMRIKVETMETGIAIPTINVLRMLRKKIKRISPASRPPMRPLLTTFWTVSRMNVELSFMERTLISGYRLRSSSIVR